MTLSELAGAKRGRHAVSVEPDRRRREEARELEAALRRSDARRRHQGRVAQRGAAAPGAASIAMGVSLGVIGLAVEVLALRHRPSREARM